MMEFNALFRTAHACFSAAAAAENAHRAAAKLRDDLAGFPVSMVVFFAATNYDPDILAASVRDAFPGAKTFGCTTAGEGVDTLLLNASVVAMAFAAGVFDHNEIALVVEDGEESAAEGIFSSADTAMWYLGRRLKQVLLQLDYRQYVGFLLADSVSFFSEALVERVGEMTDVIFAGGIAGEDCHFRDEGRVFYQGRSYRSAVVLALWKPKRGFELLKTQAVELTDKTLAVTRADENRRIVWKFNDEPAALAYAKATGLSPEAMTYFEFDDFPLALAVNGEPFLRGIARRVEPHGLQMLALVREGMRFTVTRFGDIIDSTGAALREKFGDAGRPAAILHVNCVSRHTTLKKNGCDQDFAALFDGIPNIAFSSYGEIYVGLVGMTSTMILFK